MHQAGGPFEQAGLRFHHFGLATRNAEVAGTILRSLGYQIAEQVHNKHRNTHLSMGISPTAPLIEVINPATGDNPLDRILNRLQAAIYHLSFETDSPVLSLSKLTLLGARTKCVSPSKPAILFGGPPVSFYQVVDFVLIEIIDRNGQQLDGIHHGKGSA